MLGFDDSSPLPFSVFSVLAIDEDGHLIDAKIKSLIRLFRPDREGKLSRLDFTKSVDTVYKELRLLRASIANSAQIDIAFEKIVNSFFYFFLVIVAVTILGIKIWSVSLEDDLRSSSCLYDDILKPFYRPSTYAGISFHQHSGFRLFVPLWFRCIQLL